MTATRKTRRTANSAMAATVLAVLLVPQTGATLIPHAAAMTDTPRSERALATIHAAMVEELLPYDLSLRALLDQPLAILPSDSLEHWQGVAKKGAAFRSRLQAIPDMELSEQDRLTRDYLFALARGMEDYPDIWLYVFPVTPYAGGTQHQAIRQAALRTPLATQQQRTHYLAALDAYATYIVSQRDKLKLQAGQGIRIARPAIPGAQRVIANLAKATAAFIPTPQRIEGLTAEETSNYRSQVAALVSSRIAPALDGLGAVLDEDYAAAAPARPGLMWQQGGSAHYARLVRLHTGTDLSPADVHAIGMQSLRDAKAELAQIKAAVGFTGTDRDFAALVGSDPQFAAATPQEVEAHFRRAMERIEPVLPRYFSLLPEAKYAVERAPADIEAGMTYGYYRSPTPDHPVGAYVYNGAAPESRSFANAAALIYHELLPGHHFQIALQLENQALPPLLRANAFLHLNAFVEGWAEYAADLADEMGMYRSPYERFGRLYAKMFLANRLAVDTGLNALGWTHDEARTFMRANTFASDAEIESELLRYSTDIPGQALSYAMGQRELLRMRSEAQAALGARFSFPEFHAQVLSNGALPMDILDARLKRWRTSLSD